MLNMKKSENLKKLIPALPGRKFFVFSFFLLFCMLAGVAASAQKVISGKVTNEQGNPMSGVSIQLKGTITGTVTNETGSFTITAKKGDVLVVSSINYSDLEVIV